MKQVHKGKWKPGWYIIREFSFVKPLDLHYREQEDFKLPREASGLKNIHVLIRAGFCLKKRGSGPIPIIMEEIGGIFPLGIPSILTQRQESRIMGQPVKDTGTAPPGQEARPGEFTGQPLRTGIQGGKSI